MDNAEKVSSTNVAKLDARIQNKYDSFDNWNGSSIEALSGEIAIVKTPEESVWGDTDETRSTHTV